MEGSKKRKADEADICSFGKLLKEECHKYRFPKSMNNFLELKDEDQIILKWKANPSLMSKLSAIFIKINLGRHLCQSTSL